MSKITTKSTKAEMMAEIERLTGELTAKRTETKTVVQAQEEKRIATVKESAKKTIELNILAPEIIKGYNDVQEAVELAKKELAEIQEVKEAIIDTEAVIMAKENLLSAKEATAQEELLKIKAETDGLIAKAKERIAQLEIDFDEKKAQLEKERKREAEDFAYNQKRERKIEDDKWADIKADRERKVADRETAVTERELALSAREAEIQELEIKVAGIPDAISQAKADAYAEAKKSFDKEKAIETNAVKKNAEWEIKMANMEKDRAIEDLATANAKIASLESKLEAAYASMNTLATTTVQSTGGVKILETGKDK